MRHGMIATGFLAMAALSAHAQGSAKLAVGPDAGGYLCPDGRQIWVSRCYDQSAQASCQVVHLHIKNNGLNPETAATRAELLTSLKSCALTPLEFGAQGSISLVKPKALQNKPPAAAPQAETYTVEVPLPNAPVSLLKIAGNATSVHYVDEKSVKAPDKSGRIEIWELQIFPKGNTAYPKAAAIWNRYLATCKGMQLSFETIIELDQTGEMITIRDAGGETKPTELGSIKNVIAGMACNPATFKTERVKTTAAAIKAELPAAPATAATATVTTPGPRLSLVNVSLSNPEFMFYIEELSVKPSGRKGLTEIWVLHVYAKDVPHTPGARASWEKYLINCADNLYINDAIIDVDSSGKTVKTWNGDQQTLPVPKGSVAESMADTACKKGSPKGQRLTTVADAITTAYPPPPPPPGDPFKVGSKTPPGPTTRTELFRIGSAANSVWYVDAETFDPVPNAVGVVGWVLRVITKPDPAFPGASAVWLRYHFACGARVELGGIGPHGGVMAKVEIDQTGKTRKTTASSEDEAALRPLVEGSIAEKMAKTACYVEYPNITAQLTVAAAIKDAAKPQ